MKTRTIIAAFAACLIVALTNVLPVFAGEPISGTSVGLDHDPEGIVARGTTDAKGTVVFAKLKGGSYTIVLPDISKLRGVSLISFSWGASTVTSAPIQPSKSGPVYALDKNGRKLVVDIPEGGQLTLNFTQIK